MSAEGAQSTNPPSEQPETPPPGNGAGRHEPNPDTDASPARELGIHLLRMLETRMDAAGIALQSEKQLFIARLRLKLLAGAAMFFAIWGGIVLLAVALPEHLRVPVLAAVVVVFVLTAAVAFGLGRRQPARQIGSMRWFLDNLRQDFELLSRSMSRTPEHPSASSQHAPPDGRPPSDLAA